MPEIFANNASLVTSGSDGTSCPYAGTSATWSVYELTSSWPALTSGQTMTIQDAANPSELISIIASAGPGATSITVERGAFGTAPTDHLTGATYVNVPASRQVARPSGGYAGSFATCSPEAASVPINGTLAETLPRVASGVNKVAATSGYFIAGAVRLQLGQIVGHLAWAAADPAVTPTHQWMALYTISGTLLAVTADQTTTPIGTNSYNSLAIAETAEGASSTFTVPATDAYYVGLCVVAGTAPTMFAGPPLGAIAGVFAQAPALAVYQGGGILVTPPTFPSGVSWGGNSGTDGMYWLGVEV